METENAGESLSSAEAAYFESRGAADVPDLDKEVDTPEAEAAEPSEHAQVEPDPDIAEAEADAVEASEAGKPTGQSKVPLAALTKTRAEKKAAEQRASEAERKAAVLEDRWNRFLESQQQQATEPTAEEIPDPATDPQGAIEWATKQIAAQKQREAEQNQQSEARRKAEAEWNETYRAVEADYTESVTADPSIRTAHEYLLNSQGEEFMAMGLSREEAQQEISRIEAEHIRFAKQRGLKIGPYIMSLAKARGYKTEAPKQEQRDPAKELETLAEAVDAATSLSSAGGGAPATVNAEAVANMNEADFEKWLTKNGSAKFRKMAGG